MLNRGKKKLNPSIVFNDLEIRVINAYFKKYNPKFLNDYIILLSKLGGYIGRAKDPPPGNNIIWREFNKLFELCLGFELSQKCG